MIALINEHTPKNINIQQHDFSSMLFVIRNPIIDPTINKIPMYIKILYCFIKKQILMLINAECLNYQILNLLA